MNFRTSEYPLCRHTKTNGRLCQSPALGASAYCHFHQRRSCTRAVGPGFSTNVLHPLRNARSLQEALAMVFSGLASRRIHPKTAGKMLFALQTAAKIVHQPHRNEGFSDNSNE